jgi:hypothetical protein
VERYCKFSDMTARFAFDANGKKNRRPNDSTLFESAVNIRTSVQALQWLFLEAVVLAGEPEVQYAIWKTEFERIGAVCIRP